MPLPLPMVHNVPPRMLRLCLRMAVLSLLLSIVVGDEATGGHLCIRDPSGSLFLDTQELLHGSIFECPTSPAQLRCNGRTTGSNEDYNNYQANAYCTVCDVADSCQTLAVPSFQSTSVQPVRFAPGENIIELKAQTSRNSNPFTSDQKTCRRDNANCVTKCSGCTQTITARCFMNDTAGLAAALAASNTAGVGSNNNTVATNLRNPGQPTGVSDFSAALPVLSDQRLNPACVLTQIEFRSPFRADFYNEQFVVPLSQNGTAVTTFDDCSSLTHRQVNFLTGSSSQLRLQLTAPQLCAGVRNNPYSENGPEVWDTEVGSYSFGGDFAVVRNPSGSNAPTCSSGTDRGAVVMLLPLPALLSSTITATAQHSSIGSLCADGSCVGGNDDGRCSSCSYTYEVRFRCSLNYFDCAAPPNTTHNPCTKDQICSNGQTIYSRPVCTVPLASSSTGGQGSFSGDSSSNAEWLSSSSTSISTMTSSTTNSASEDSSSGISGSSSSDSTESSASTAQQQVAADKASTSSLHAASNVLSHAICVAIVLIMSQ